MTAAVAQMHETRANQGEDEPLRLVVGRTRLVLERRRAWLEHVGVGADRTIKEILQGKDDPFEEAQWYSRSDESGVIRANLERLEENLAAANDSRLAFACRAFELTPFECEVLYTSLALTIDPALNAVLDELFPLGTVRGLTVGRASRLAGRVAGTIDDDSALRRWCLLRLDRGWPRSEQRITVDPAFLAWLQQRLVQDEPLLGATSLIEPQPAVDEWPINPTAAHIEAATTAGIATRVVISGSSGSGRRTFASCVARRFGWSALGVDTGRVADDDWQRAFVLVQRTAVLNGMAIIWHGTRLDRPWPLELPFPPGQFVVVDEDQALAPVDGVVDHQLSLQVPGSEERRRLWRKLVPGAATWAAHETDALAERHRLHVGDIADIGRRLPRRIEDATELARERRREQLGELARLLPCSFDWDDLVLPESLRDSLRDFSYEARARAAFWEQPRAQRLFPRGRGLVGLLTGLPGTGKTMAAQVIAAELDLDLFRIDLATLVSKYIGETAKNLRQLFARAAHTNAVLLFDEADALFTKRTEVKDAHDRYANADTNYLLQQLEDYDGVALLASNKKGNLDAAFIRRIRFIFDFPKPDPAARAEIWGRLIRELEGPEVLARCKPHLENVAQVVELSGAQIKNAVLAASFSARREGGQATIDQYLRGVERELAKEGRHLSPRERGRLGRHG